MDRYSTPMVLAGGAVAVAMILVGCGSGSSTEAPSSSAGSTESSSSPAAAATSTSVAAAGTTTASGANYTVGDYLRDNGLTQTMVKRGDPGAPELNLPMPPGWSDVGKDTPDDAYGAIVLTEAMQSANPPAIVARMARVSGDIDQAKVLELAPNAVRNQPGFQGPDAGQSATLAGYEAAVIAGTVDQNGQPVFVARKTVVIPGQDAIYLLALDAQGAPDRQPALMEAMSVIDSETIIEP